MKARKLHFFSLEDVVQVGIDLLTLDFVGSGHVVSHHVNHFTFHPKAGSRPGQYIPPSLTDMMRKMLQLDPNQRITPRELLEHPFISLESGEQPTSGCPEPSGEQIYLYIYL